MTSPYIAAGSRPSFDAWRMHVIESVYRARRVAPLPHPDNEGGSNPIHDTSRDGPECHSPAVSISFQHGCN